MKLKDRFTAYKNEVTGRTSVMDNKTHRILTSLEAEYIFQEEYGESFSTKTKYQAKIIDTIVAQIEHYNNILDDDFKITLDDLRTILLRKNDKHSI